jgi:hypothetical protein
MKMAKTIKLHIEIDKDTYQVGDDVTVQVRDEKGNDCECNHASCSPVRFRKTVHSLSKLMLTGEAENE